MNIRNLIDRLRANNTYYSLNNTQEAITEEEAKELGEVLEKFTDEKLTLHTIITSHPLSSQFICLIFNSLEKNKYLKKFILSRSLFSVDNNGKIFNNPNDKRWVIDDEATFALCNLLRANKTLTVEIHSFFINQFNVIKIVEALDENENVLNFNYKHAEENTLVMKVLGIDSTTLEELEIAEFNYIRQRNEGIANLRKLINKKLLEIEDGSEEEELVNIYDECLNEINNFEEEYERSLFEHVKSICVKNVCRELRGEIYFSMAKKYLQKEQIEEGIFYFYQARFLSESRLELASLLLTRYKEQPFLKNSIEDLIFILMLLQGSNGEATIQLRNTTYSLLENELKREPSKIPNYSQNEKRQKVISLKEFTDIIKKILCRDDNKPHEKIILNFAAFGPLIFNMPERIPSSVKKRYLENFKNEYQSETSEEYEASHFPTVTDVAAIPSVEKELNNKYGTTNVVVFEEQFLSLINKDLESRVDLFDLHVNFNRFKEEYVSKFEKKLDSLMSESSVDKLKNALKIISTKKSFSLIQKKKEALSQVALLIGDIKSVKELADFLFWLKDETKENKSLSFIRKERHYPFIRFSPYGNTATWYEIVGHIKERAFDLAQKKQTINAEENQFFLEIFDEQRKRIKGGMTVYHRFYETLSYKIIDEDKPKISTK